MESLHAFISSVGYDCYFRRAACVQVFGNLTLLRSGVSVLCCRKCRSYCAVPFARTVYVTCDYVAMTVAAENIRNIAIFSQVSKSYFYIIRQVRSPYNPFDSPGAY